MNQNRSRHKRSLILFLFCAIVFISCNDTKEDDKDDLIENTDTVKTAVLNIDGELFSIPSPIQTALLIQKSGIDYNKNVLSASNKVNTFPTDYSRALNLGVFGADLGYVSLYNQTQDALGYLAAIKQLSDKLGLTAAFDAGTMERIKNNITNKDSMMVLVGIAYRGSDSYLKNNQRNDISSLILAGGWVEGVYFSAEAYKLKPNAVIKQRIAEQKQALNSLVKILGNNSSPEVAELTTMMSDLAKVYEGIQFKYNFVKPETDSIKKVTYINSTIEVMVSEEQITQIISKLGEIRSKIVNTTKS